MAGYLAHEITQHPDVYREETSLFCSYCNKALIVDHLPQVRRYVLAAPGAKNPLPMCDACHNKYHWQYPIVKKIRVGFDPVLFHWTEYRIREIWPNFPYRPWTPTAISRRLESFIRYHWMKIGKYSGVFPPSDPEIPF